MVIRGEIWWADLPVPVGSAPGYRRPVLVVQSDRLNRSSLQTVICIGVTSNLARAGARGNVMLSSSATGLPRDSVANVSQVLTLDRQQLTAMAGRVTQALMQAVDDGLRLTLAL